MKYFSKYQHFYNINNFWACKFNSTNGSWNLIINEGKMNYGVFLNLDVGRQDATFPHDSSSVAAAFPDPKCHSYNHNYS